MALGPQRSKSWLTWSLILNVVSYINVMQSTMESALSGAQEEYCKKLEQALEEERERSQTAIERAMDEERGKTTSHIGEIKVRST
jgi:hypothetical protein